MILAIKFEFKLILNDLNRIKIILAIKFEFKLILNDLN